jgi:hypothetical protein
MRNTVGSDKLLLGLSDYENNIKVCMVRTGMIWRMEKRFFTKCWTKPIQRFCQKKVTKAQAACLSEVE